MQLHCQNSRNAATHPTVPKRGDDPDEFLSRSARLCVFPRSIPGAWFASVCCAGSGDWVIGMATKGCNAGVGPVGDRRAAIEHRLSVRCVSCAYETTGWTIGEDRSRAHAAALSRARIETCHAR